MMGEWTKGEVKGGKEEQNRMTKTRKCKPLLVRQLSKVTSNVVSNIIRNREILVIT